MTIIAHLDMDAFFAAIEERDNPPWQGKPIVVGADPKNGYGRGVVSTANYAARKYGIRSALPISQAWQLAQAAKQQGEPETIFVQGSWRNYSATSKRIMEIVNRFASDIEQTGIDEAYLDLTFTKSFSAAEKLSRNIKQEIYEQAHLTCSIGIGPNKLIAKIASDFKKPDGLTTVLPEEAENFLEPLSIRAIPGIGPKTEAKLNRRGVKIIKDLKQFSRAEIGDLYDRARGLGSRKLSQGEPPKSISEQQTFAHDTRDPNLLTTTLHDITHRLISDLKQQSHITIYRTVTVTVRFADFETHTYSHTLKKPTNSLDILKIESLRLFLPFLDHRKNPHGKLIRAVGLRIEKLA